VTDTIVAVNRSTVLTDADIKACLPAFQGSMDNFNSVWSIQGKIEFVGANDQPPPDAWQLLILDHTDTPGAGGYHYDTRGRVGGKIFAGDAIAFKAPWTIDFTHEMLEMLGDPMTDTIVPLPHSRYEWFQEVCDPCEADQFAYQINGVWVTDFVTPAYCFKDTGAFDFQGHLKSGAPTLLAGGYITLYDPWTMEYHQRFAAQADGMLSRRAMSSHRMRHALLEAQL
jgi:hypothetical protein